MNAPPESQEPIAAPRKRGRRRILRAFLAAVLVLLAVVALMMVLTPAAGPSVLWLTPGEMSQRTKPGVLTRLKWQLMNFTGPLQRWYRLPRGSVLVRSDLLKLSEEAAMRTGLGTPTTSGANGVRAWILPPTELEAFRERLKSFPGATIESSPRILTGDGGQARASVGSTVSVAGKPEFSGLAVDLTPRIARASVSLLLGVIATERANLSSNAAAVIRTNLTLNCQIRLGNGCGLVVDGGNARDGNSNGWWFIISPTILDSKGNRIKP
jgi:hypothetical protein